MYDSMDEVTSSLTKDVFTESDLEQWVANGITVEEMVRAGWDIVEVDGKLYVFMK
ncbi:MAG TPA: hypothetical protein VHX38_41485 [Pseudonocardiaceae bacterium]|jgi:hypothetical protein|nr:hypothetical protein [Pseudonocardiaceae bacterium]